ncbi:MAG: plastocyanin/azurin family copper-binding protein, partial [Thermomicrobiales bacterium]
MSTLNRRRFSLLGIGGFASVAVVGCGNEVGNEVAIQPTQITDVPGAPPTLADMATPGGVSEEEDAGTGGGAEAPAGEEVTVESLDTLRYDPEQLTASPGSVITMTNVGVVQHNFVVDDLGGEVIPLLNGGESASWTVPADAPLGDHVFYCSVPGHAQAGMDGTLSLVEASAAAPSGEGEA